MNPPRFLSVTNLNSSEILAVVERATAMKKGEASKALAGRTVALLFEKPSLRTRGSFEVGIHQLGGHCFYTGGQEVGLGVREPVSDVAKVLSRYVDGIVARVNSHTALEEFASNASVMVVNALSDWEHPCQTLADLQTMREVKGRLEGLRVAFVGDGNNVARSLALGVASVGGSFVIASPPGYHLDGASLEEAAVRAAEAGAPPPLMLTEPGEAVVDADVVYTDVWISMGDEQDRAARLSDFRGYTVTPELLSLARPDAIFMHDMPAHYGEEVPPGMLDHPQSVAFDQAENRLHAQKSLLEYLNRHGD